MIPYSDRNAAALRRACLQLRLAFVRDMGHALVYEANGQAKSGMPWRLQARAHREAHRDLVHLLSKLNAWRSCAR